MPRIRARNLRLRTPSPHPHSRRATARAARIRNNAFTRTVSTAVLINPAARIRPTRPHPGPLPAPAPTDLQLYLPAPPHPHQCARNYTRKSSFPRPLHSRALFRSGCPHSTHAPAPRPSCQLTRLPAFDPGAATSPAPTDPQSNPPAPLARVPTCPSSNAASTSPTCGVVDQRTPARCPSALVARTVIYRLSPGMVLTHPFSPPSSISASWKNHGTSLSIKPSGVCCSLDRYSIPAQGSATRHVPRRPYPCLSICTLACRCFPFTVFSTPPPLL
ncbi:hypothetical protein R3P38DRAFT_3179357 [Favolaschia claudopus]|uniref:Uncharacterized protein n=1 Tax=Favolaschia claudopus TaxID=2862362 RepID=A0AAW0CXA2_9AGAR